MVEVIINRVLVELDDLKRYHEVERPDGTKVKIEVAYGEYETRLRATVTEGSVVAVGETAYNDYGYTKEDKPVKAGDRVIFAKYSARPVLDPDEPERRLAMLNDEDVIAIIKSKENT